LVNEGQNMMYHRGIAICFLYTEWRLYNSVQIKRKTEKR